ncbi:MAG: gene transfer agent family protein [Sphingomonadaceae bacterium]
MSRPANPLRGEASIPVNGREYLLRPSFLALIAAEEELGPLFALVERAADGRLSLADITGLFWHCLEDNTALDREQFSDAIVRLGLARSAPPLRILLGQILQGQV